MKIFRIFVFLAVTLLATSTAPPAQACCGDGAAAARGAEKAGALVTTAIETATSTIIGWLRTMTLAIGSGFGKVTAEIMKQTAAMRIIEEGKITVQTQLYMEKVRADAQSKYKLSPRVCYESAGGSATAVAVGETRETLNDLNRGFADRTLFTPSSQAAIGKIYKDHADKYCSHQDADLGRCASTADAKMQNADVLAGSIFESSSYTPQQIDAAKAFMANVVNPIPSQNIPKDWEATPAGQSFVAGQYIEQARASVAANSFNAAIASRIPIAGLGSGALLNKADVSELELMESQVRGRFESSEWYKMLAGFSSENLMREANKMMALNSRIDMGSYQQMERIETILATQLAIEVKRDSEPRLREARNMAAKAVK